MKAQLRAVNNEQEHPRDRARREVKRWRSNAEKEKLPVSNQHEDQVKPVLLVDEVLERAFKQIG